MLPSDHTLAGGKQNPIGRTRQCTVRGGGNHQVPMALRRGKGAREGQAYIGLGEGGITAKRGLLVSGRASRPAR